MWWALGYPAGAHAWASPRRPANERLKASPPMTRGLAWLATLRRACREPPPPAALCGAGRTGGPTDPLVGLAHVGPPGLEKKRRRAGAFLPSADHHPPPSFRGGSTPSQPVDGQAAEGAPRLCQAPPLARVAHYDGPGSAAGSRRSGIAATRWERRKALLYQLMDPS